MLYVETVMIAFVAYRVSLKLLFQGRYTVQTRAPRRVLQSRLSFVTGRELVLSIETERVSQRV